MRVRASFAGVILLTILASACASHTARPQPFPRTGGEEPVRDEERRPRTEREAERVNSVVGLALRLRGRPYAPGGAGPEAFDCSGLVQYVFAQHDIPLPRTVSEQFEATRAIDPREADAGDLLFFRISGRKPSHVGIAIGGGQFVHAPSGNGVVRVESLEAPYWRKRFASARRLDGQ